SIEIKKKSGEVKTVELEIKRFSTVTEETISWPEPDTAVIRINTFSAGYGRTNVEDLMDEAAKAKYLVVDLRSNGGGSIFNLMHFLSVVLPNRTDIGTFISRRTADRYTAELPGAIPDPVAIAKWTDRHMRTFSRGHDPFAGKIAVLINRGSASASEIAAAALRDNVGAKLVGTRSAGAVLASTYRRLPDGWSIQYPVSDFVTSKFVRIEGHPLQPDVEVIGRPTPDDPDPAVAAAIKSLKG
ncbi:MAG TPA: S41 family peptidase, partial [Fimbriimonadaceae bacterium]|nr:S41 family peptidase [Fimbriimonadaceae bacterium]